MASSTYRRERHGVIFRLLRSLNRDLLLRTECAFGGGTLVALCYGEHRESMDIDFLCSSGDGYRLLRETLFGTRLEPLVGKLALAREPVMDRDGVRTFLADPSGKSPPVKLEVLLEGRIVIESQNDPKFPVPRLTPASLIAEKLLANADRGGAVSESGKDFIDLLAILRHEPVATFAAGMKIAVGAYGKVVRKALDDSMRAHSNAALRKIRLGALGVDDEWFNSEAGWKAVIMTALKQVRTRAG
jgi:hypothetical protein